MKKKLSALILALILLTVPAAAFSDVDEGLYYAAPIAWAAEQGIAAGTSANTFSPDAFCTRAQIATFLWRAAGSPEPQSMASPYSDVVPGMNADFYRAILWAGESGIIRPADLDGDRFSPSEPCTRAFAMSSLWRYTGSPAAAAPAAFTDVAPEADYAQAVAWAIEADITTGTTDTTFSPSDPCTRGQAAVFLYRCLNEADPAEKVLIPEDPVPAKSAPEPAGPPLRTYAGTGKARSLGLDGSEFTSEGIYDAEVKVDVYSPYEAVFTIDVPFPLYQACSYLVRFDDQDQSGRSYLFTFLRWDEAFADMIHWEGSHDSLRFVDASGQTGSFSVQQDASGDDRTGGSLVRRVTFSQDSYFNFDMLSGYEVSCSVSAQP